MYVPEEMWIPVGSFAVGRLWVSETAERILFLTDYEGICWTGGGKRGIIDPQLKWERNFRVNILTSHYLVHFPDLDETLV